MEEAVLRQLDEMFRDLREEIKQKHLADVHVVKDLQHQDHCHASEQAKLAQRRRFSLPGNVCAARRDSAPRLSHDAAAVRRGSLTLPNGTAPGRRCSLPILPIARRDSSKIPRDASLAAVAAAAAPPMRRDSVSAYRKFSRDSIDLDLVVEDAAEADADADADDSVILEEDEAQLQDEVQSFQISSIESK